jgi:CO/xanthine dehydrogenase FAD-binding subunit
MKPPKFDYYAPTTLDEALELLAQHGDDAKVLAGGQSLMPLLNMRLSRPSVIIDINRVAGLDYVEEDNGGGLKIGSMTRQRTLERSPLVQRNNPLIVQAMSQVGHFQIRNRGTIGGSVVHADPAAELPALCLAMDAQLVLSSSSGQRVANAGEMFLTYFTTSIEPTELITEIQLPALPAVWGFQEVSRRHGDFALVGAVTLAGLNSDRAATDARIVLFGVDGTPVRVEEAEQKLQGRALDEDALEEASEAVKVALDPETDLHASAEYRKEVGGVMVRRALEEALARG